MTKPTLTVIAFPGNNCETETARAAERNGFEANIIRWNQIDKVGQSDAYILPGGFSFEDRGRSGALASREPIFDALREEAKKGKVILGICNGAQMIVESGLIPIAENPLPLALADNVRRDKEGHVLGTGFYNTWSYLKPERTNTAFTNQITKPIHVPVAHGEGRFSTIDTSVVDTLAGSENVAFRYSNENGAIESAYPTTPNGAVHAVAAITNKEGTIMAIMPHPERFFDIFDGDEVLTSIKNWIENKQSPKTVKIGDFTTLPTPDINDFDAGKSTLIIETELIITDNECFSVGEVAKRVASDSSLQLEKSTLFVITGDATKDELIDTGMILNQNKERLIEEAHGAHKYGSILMDDDKAEHLSEKLTALLGKDVHVKMYKCWDFGETDGLSVQKVLQNRLLSNPNSSTFVKL